MSSRLVSSVALAAGLALPSCGGDESGGGGTPAPTKAELACQALVDTITGCSAPTACEQALADDCASVAGMLGDPYLDAFDACLDGGGDPASCALGAGVGLTPTAGQHAFAESFCKNCALGVPGCVDVLFGGENAELAPVAAIVAPLSDDLVDEITTQCTTGLTCLTTFQSCVQGVIVKRAIPDETLGCFVGMLLGTEHGSVECGQDGPGGGGEGGASGGAGGGTSSVGGTGAGGPGGAGAGGGQGGESGCALDPWEPNETLPGAKTIPGGGDGIISDCDGDESISGVLAGAGDDDWLRYDGMDGLCGLDDIQPHASVDAGYPVKVCVYVNPLSDSDPPTCMTGAPASAGSFVGCCGDGAARLAFGGNLANDDADVRISLSTLADVCVDYEVTYGFGAGP